MQFSVVELYIGGIRRSRDEAQQAVPVLGDLTVTDWASGNALGRPLRVAHLKTRCVSTPSAGLMPLFEPVIIRMTSTGFVLRGIQFQSTSGERHEVAQEWWVRSVAAQ